MLPWMATLTEKLADREDLRSRTRAALVWVIARFVSILDHAGRFLSEEEYLEVQHVGKVFTSAYVRLAKMAHAKSEYLWKIKPKLHYLVHHF